MWNLAQNDLIISETIESGVCALQESFVDFTGVFTELEVIESKSSLALDAAAQLTSSLDEIEVLQKSTYSKICIVNQDITAIGSLVEQVSSAITAIDMLGTTICSKLETISDQLNVAQQEVELLENSAIDNGTTITSKLAQVDQQATGLVNDLDQALSVLDVLAAQEAVQLLCSCLLPLASDIDTLQDDVLDDFTGVFTVEIFNESKACLIQSLADEVSIVPIIDASGTFTALDALQVLLMVWCCLIYRVSQVK
jgi:hypothetical protein